MLRSVAADLFMAALVHDAMGVVVADVVSKKTQRFTARRRVISAREGNRACGCNRHQPSCEHRALGLSRSPSEGITMKTSFSDALVAAAVASMFATGCASPSAMTKSDKMAGGSVHCGGVNGCKGQGSCGGATNTCAGQNACKGQGWVAAGSEKECTDKGGTVVAAKM